MCGIAEIILWDRGSVIDSAKEILTNTVPKKVSCVYDSKYFHSYMKINVK